MTKSNSHSDGNCSHFINSGGSNSHFISGKREATDTRFYLFCTCPAYWAQDYCLKENLFPRMVNRSCLPTIVWEARCLKHCCLAKKILLPRCIYFSSSSYLFRIIPLPIQLADQAKSLFCKKYMAALLVSLQSSCSLAYREAKKLCRNWGVQV